MRIRVNGLSNLRDNLRDLGRRYGQAKLRAAIAGAHLVRNDAIRSIQQISPGRSVVREREGGRTYNHVAAFAGYAPNNDTGALVTSIAVEIRQDRVFVAANAEYASALEFGEGRMGARPFLYPAAEKNRRAIREIYKRELRRV